LILRQETSQKFLSGFFKKASTGATVAGKTSTFSHHMI
jgi:hypothetical protein